MDDGERGRGCPNRGENNEIMMGGKKTKKLNYETTGRQLEPRKLR